MTRKRLATGSALAALMFGALLLCAPATPQRASKRQSPRKDKPMRTEIATFGGG